MKAPLVKKKQNIIIDELINKSESTYKIAEILVGQIKESLKNFDMNKIQDGFIGLKEVFDKNE